MRKIYSLTNFLVKVMFWSVALLVTTKLFAVPAIPTPVEVEQPNGEKIIIRLHGDEYANYSTTTDGYVITTDEDGKYVYSTQTVDGLLEPTGIEVHNVAKRTQEEEKFLRTIPAGLTEKTQEVMRVRAEEGRKEYQQNRGQVLDVSGVSQAQADGPEGAQFAAAHSGQRRFCVILVQFTDYGFQKGAEMSNMLNQDGFQGTGSVAEYYRNSSWNKFQPIYEVWGPVTVPMTKRQARDDTGQMIYYACQQADALGANFANYDTDNNGEVDNVYCFFAGYDRAQGGGEDCIWSHASGIGHKNLYLDGKKVSGYGCSSELKGNSGSNRVNIGTFTHEFAHVIGLPDYYDTDGGDNGNGHTPGGWSLMASGCYNHDSSRPPLLSAVDRQHLGWATIPNMPNGSIRLNKIQDCQGTGGYRVNTDMNDEYFVFEHREQTGFDYSLPSSGMLIWHVDRSTGRYIRYYTQNQWWDSYFTARILWDNWNGPNNVQSHPCIDLVEAYGPHNNSGDTGFWNTAMWGIGGNAIQPRAWSGALTGANVTDIANHGTYSTFNCNGSSGGTTNPEPTCSTTDRPVAHFYQDSNYGGTGKGLPEGNYTTAQMRAFCIEDNWISSIKVLPGYKVTVYADDNFGGSSAVFTENSTYVGGDWNDKISSIKIEASGVTGLGGVYKIKGHNGKYLDLDGNSNAANAAIVQYDNEGLEIYQHWQLVEVGTGVYSIKAVSNTSRGWDVYYGKVENRTQVLLYDYNGGANQQFIAVKRGDYYQFVARHCGKVVEIPDFSTQNGEWIKLYDNNNQTCSYWQLEKSKPSGFPISTVYDDINYGGASLGLPEGEYTSNSLRIFGFNPGIMTSAKILPGYRMTLYSEDNFTGNTKIIDANTSYVGNDWNDKMKSVRVEAWGVSGVSGQYKIQGRNSGLFLDMNGNSSANGTRVVQWRDEDEELYQQFHFEEIGNGVYSIYAHNSGKVFDVEGANTDNRADISIYTNNRQAHQQFILVDAGDGYYQFVARHCGKVIELPNNSKTEGEQVKLWDNNAQTCSHWKLKTAYNYVVVFAEDMSQFDGYLDLRDCSWYPWDNTLEMSEYRGADVPEGVASIKFSPVSAAQSSWFGIGANINDGAHGAYNLSFLSDYSLCFMYKSNYPKTLYVKLAGFDSNGNQIEKMAPIVTAADNKWHQSVIPMSKFTEQGMNFGEISNQLIFSLVSEENTGSGYTVYMDNVYYAKSSYAAVDCSTTVNITKNHDVNCKGDAILTANANETVTYKWSNSLGTSSTAKPTSAGKYTVTATNGSGCSVSASISVSENKQLPTIGIDGNSNLNCTKTALTLSATGANIASYKWTSNETSSTKVVTAGGTYGVVATHNTSGCSASATAEVRKDETKPNISILGNDVLTCNKTKITVTANGGVDFHWSTGETTNTKEISGAGEYTVEMADANSGCKANYKFTVTENKVAPAVTISGAKDITCKLTSMELIANNNATTPSFKWSNGGTASNAIITAMGDYIVTVTDESNGCSATKAVTISENKENVSVAIEGNEILTCDKESITLVAVANYADSYKWADGNTNSSKVIENAGKKSVTVTYGTCTASASVNVTENKTAPIVAIAGNEDLTCTKTQIILTASGADSYTWTSGEKVATKEVTAAGTYSVVGRNANGCEASASVSVANIKDLDDVTISGDKVITCQNNVVTLTAVSAGASFTWSTGEKTASISASESKVYSVTATKGACTSTASVAVSDSRTNIIVSVSTNNSNVKVGSSFTLTASANSGNDFTWYKNNAKVGTGSTFTIANAQKSDAAEYKAIVKDGSCVGEASITIAVNNADAPTINTQPASQTATVGDNVTFSIATEAGCTYQWYKNGVQVGTGNTYTINGVSKADDGAQIYCDVTKNGTTAKSSTATLTVKYAAPTGVTINGATSAKVGDAAIVLTAVATGEQLTYTWSTGEISATKTVSTSAKGSVDLVVTVSNESGEATASVTVVINAADPANITSQPSNKSAYVGDNVTFEIVTELGCTYQWYKNGVKITGANQSTYTLEDVQKTDDGATIYCDVTKNGTTISSSTVVLTVSYKAPSNLRVLGQTSAKVGEPAIILTASADGDAVEYQWSNGDQGAIVTCPTTAAGTYVLTVFAINESGNVSAVVTITINPADAPKINEEPEDKTATVGDDVTFSIATEEGCTYQWYKNGQVVVGENGSTYTLNGVSKEDNGAQIYCDVTKNGTTAKSSTATLIVKNVAPLSVTIIGVKEAKVGDPTIVLTAVAEGQDLVYKWSTGELTAVKSISTSTKAVYTISVEVSNDGGKVTASTTVEIFNAKPTDVRIDLNDTEIEEGDNVSFTVNATGDELQYQWFKDGQPLDGETGSTLTILDAQLDNSGNYSCEVSNESGSVISNEVGLTVSEKAPDVDLEINTFVEKPIVGEETAYEISNSDEDLEYTWTVEGGRIINGQGGDRVSIIWETEGEHIITVVPSKNGKSGRPTIVTTTAFPPVAISIESVKVTIYPNPTPDIINMDIPNDVEVENIVLYELSGKMIMSVEPNVRTISLNNLGKGVYLLNIKTSSQSIVSQVIVY